jgi:hypothetical protein
MKKTNKYDLINFLLHKLDEFIEGIDEFNKIEIHFNKPNIVYINTTEANSTFSLSEVAIEEKD